MGAKLCHQCGFDIEESSDFLQIDVCSHCGWVQTTAQEKNKAAPSRYPLFASFGFGAFLIGAVIHIANWGQHSFEVLWMNEDSNRKFEICMSLKKYDCAEASLAARSLSHPEDLALRSELGIFQFQRLNYEASIETLNSYLEAGGSDLYAQYTLAKSYAEAGLHEQALVELEKILAAKPDTLQVTVARTYFELLVEIGRSNEAVQFVSKVRKKGSNASNFMEEELRQIASAK